MCLIVRGPHRARDILLSVTESEMSSRRLRPFPTSKKSGLEAPDHRAYVRAIASQSIYILQPVTL